MNSLEFTERAFTWNAVQTECDRQFAMPYLRFGYLEAWPVPDRFSDVGLYFKSDVDDRLTSEKRAANSRRRRAP